ncbi:DUF2905 domain-containing protein [Desulfofustis glycolicus]|uniref:DUF2905 domain-containing protein n=1 Tax=Desulfofustis glycolicus DSM 9705 TaxID=1121409 RepID=A0A1M5VGT0_9BACT|nr:DUF2905 domain-containing protein [Desulfofustis glycolicus]MCB2217571.1 DUF2905 domain-containing protein [Desulfobulbaceae bacterium]SHH74385.1 Protein of unknown function [Desulfofustis glycolicus DSM 9705]
MSRLLIIAGIILIAIGAGWPLLQKVGLGRLPGDISIGNERFHIYLPISTSLIVSIIVSLLVWLFRK